MKKLLLTRVMQGATCAFLWAVGSGWMVSFILGYGMLAEPALAAWTHVVIDAQMSGDDKILTDIDGDGFIDIVVGGSRSAGEALTWYRYPGWDKHSIALPAIEFTTEMDAGDMDGDGDIDLVVCDGNTGINCRYYRNPRPAASPLVAANWQAVPIGEGGGWVHDLRVGDYNKDGRLDVLTSAGLFTQSVTGGFGKGSPAGSVFGDLDNDGDLDIVAAGFWYENPGWAQHPAPGGGGDDQKIRVGDINGDGTMDVVVNSGDGTGDLAWYSSASPKSGNWVKHLIKANRVGGHTLALGDVDGDGDTDVLSAEMFGEVAVYFNAGAGTFYEEIIAHDGAHNGVLGDVDRDGDLDILGCDYTGNPPVDLWRNDRSSNPPQPPPISSGTKALPAWHLLLLK